MINQYQMVTSQRLTAGLKPVPRTIPEPPDWSLAVNFMLALYASTAGYFQKMPKGKSDLTRCPLGGRAAARPINSNGRLLSQAKREWRGATSSLFPPITTHYGWSIGGDSCGRWWWLWATVGAISGKACLWSHESRNISVQSRKAWFWIITAAEVKASLPGSKKRWFININNP